MLTKLLLTLLVIAGCFLLLKWQRRRPSQGAIAAPVSRKPARLVWVLLGLVLLLVVGGATLAVLEWQDQRVLLEVRVINPLSGDEQRYRVYRSALQGRQFTTIDGLQVQLSDAERVDVQELAAQ